MLESEEANIKTFELYQGRCFIEQKLGQRTLVHGCGSWWRVRLINMKMQHSATTLGRHAHNRTSASYGTRRLHAASTSLQADSTSLQAASTSLKAASTSPQAASTSLQAAAAAFQAGAHCAGSGTAPPAQHRFHTGFQ